jgi:cell wall-associated NlpC family hydrolase
VRGLLESKAYLKNPDSAEATAARQEAVVLDRINNILSGGQIAAARAVQDSQNARAVQDSQNAGSATNNNMADNTTVNENNATNNSVRGSPTVSLLTADDNSTSKYRKSPATMMAEASLLSQEAALKEADNLKNMIGVQKEENATMETRC